MIWRAAPTIRVTISPVLRDLSQLDGLPDSLEVTGYSARECLRAVAEEFPAVKKFTYDKDDKIQPLICFFVNRRRLGTDELASPLKENDELLIALFPS